MCALAASPLLKLVNHTILIFITLNIHAYVTVHLIHSFTGHFTYMHFEQCHNLVSCIIIVAYQCIYAYVYKCK